MASLHAIAVPAIAAVLLASAAPARASQRLDPMAMCQASRPSAAFHRSHSNNLTISNETKRPQRFQAFRPGDVLMAVADPAGRISTSPGQVFFNNGTWGPGGNGEPAGGDWLLPGRSQFAVSLRTAGIRQIVGHKSACIRWPGGNATVPVEFGLNVVQDGWGSPLTNRWDGSIGVRLTVHHA